MLDYAHSRTIDYKMPANEHSHQLGTEANSWLSPISGLAEMAIRYEAQENILWQFMKPSGRPSISPGLLRDALTVMDAVENAHSSLEIPPVRYMVLASGIAGVYNLGGDLALFRQKIANADREALRHYAHTCIEVQYRRAVKMNLPICTIALVQGDALGGGFEAALAHDVIVAEKSAKFGLPEILFNLFPGMGAYSFLVRRIDAVRAEGLMTSGRIYSAEELYQMGVVDVLAEDGDGEDAVRRFIDTHRRASKSRLAIAKLRNFVSPICKQELIGITDLWVETALTLDAKDLRRMEHLVAAQTRRAAGLVDSGGGQRATA